ICIDMPDLFKIKLRAIYRAGILGNVRLLLPMITSIEELRYVKTLTEEVKLDLSNQNIEYDANIPIGVMIEVPSAVMIADQLAKEADFFSIGTNDLVQYALAVDRGNPKVAYLYNFFHPAVLRLIEMTVKAGNDHKIPVSMCGEMAGDPFATILLFGIGIKEFSVSPVMMLKIKQILRCLEFSEAQKIAGHCLKMQTADEIENYMRNVMLELFPNMDEDNFFPENS
ncbi:phosphoenolpyruvate--protein phosphotransferase, partial [candidate division KSB1 bacterium]|nr:phosphoenolpyruvate--protein phosphotransferase [candidate division KSB1 bacterium]